MIKKEGGVQLSNHAQRDPVERLLLSVINEYGGAI